MRLRDYYENLPEPTAPKTQFVEEVARRCGVKQGTVRLWIFGRAKPSNPVHAQIISEMTNIPIDVLFG